MDGALGIFEGEIPRENEASRAFRSWWHYHARMESQVSFEHEMTYATSIRMKLKLKEPWMLLLPSQTPSIIFSILTTIHSLSFFFFHSSSQIPLFIHLPLLFFCSKELSFYSRGIVEPGDRHRHRP